MKIDIPEHNVVTLKPSEMEFNDFNCFVRKAYNDHLHYCGGVLVTPPSTFTNYVPDLKSLQTEIVHPYEQIYKKMAKGFILLTMKNKVELVTGIFIQEYS